MPEGHWLFMSKSMVTVFISTFSVPPLAVPVTQEETKNPLTLLFSLSMSLICHHVWIGHPPKGRSWQSWQTFLTGLCFYSARANKAIPISDVRIITLKQIFCYAIPCDTHVEVQTLPVIVKVWHTRFIKLRHCPITFILPYASWTLPHTHIHVLNHRRIALLYCPASTPQIQLLSCPAISFHSLLLHPFLSPLKTLYYYYLSIVGMQCYIVSGV